MQGFLVFDHNDLLPEFSREVGGWVQSGQLKYAETIVEGFEHTAEAFIDMLAGANTGKMVVAL